MDVPQGLVFIFYMFVAFFAIGTIFKRLFSGQDCGSRRDPAHGQVSSA